MPNLLIQYKLRETIEKAYSETGRKVHLVGHSLGGVIARAAASQMPDRIASVIAMGSPFRGVSLHHSILSLAQLVRGQILDRHGDGVLPACYTAACTCNFLESLMGKMPKSVAETAIYTKSDGIVDWRVCQTGNSANDFEVSSTHIGLAFNPIVYEWWHTAWGARHRPGAAAGRPCGSAGGPQLNRRAAWIRVEHRG